MFKITQQDLSEDSEIERLFESPEPSDQGDDDDDEKGDDGNGGGGFPATIIPNTTSTGGVTGGGAPEIDTQSPDGVTTYQNPTGTGILHTAPGLEEEDSSMPVVPENDNTNDTPGELSMQPTTTPQLPVPEVPEAQREVYEPKPNETFQEHRARVERQETLLFDPRTYGPTRTTTSRNTPYSRTPDETTMNVELEIDVLQNTKLPSGWKVEDGLVVLEEPKDDWMLQDNYLVRRHFLPRQRGFVPTNENCPVPVKYLKKERYTTQNGRLVRDKWTRPSRNKKLEESMWTGCTRFRIHTTWKPKVTEEFYMAGDGFEAIYYDGAQPTGPITEKYMTSSDRKAFYEAKRKELESFFQNNVWHFDDSKNAEQSRVLRARFLLNWKKNSDGTPRAKARLIVQGFRDPDALSGSLSTASPTLTRLSRNFILTIASMQDFQPFTADITTAFLQGKEFPKDSDRVIWIKLPKDGENILGLQGEHGKLMKLTKPMYGLCDAPRAWFEEASERILEVGHGRIIQHPLDACLFMVFNEVPEAAKKAKLVGLFGLHVDDLFGCFDTKDAVSKEIQKQIHETFSFREWIVDDKLEYCGSNIQKIDNNHWRLHHERYLTKQKPITVPKERAGTELPVTEAERTQLRGLLGALQWPSTQSAPHLQAMVSMLSGDVTKATVKTLESANKALRFAKANSDVGLDYRRLGSKDDITFVAYSDASFACRSDLSSQGGYMVVMVSKEVANGMAGHYVIVDWRSWKLQRVARSTLCAESQAASEAADALLYTVTFWNLVWQPWLGLDTQEVTKMPLQPRLVVDAKALYDLLVKPEVQASSGSDKRTTIEVLVTQDKLACCGGKTMWVSSELQYADGLTKDSAAQLLADRMRSHLTRLKADETFQAAKKKDAGQRKKNAEMYAIKKPKRALHAMMATVMMASAMGQPGGESYIYIDQSNDLLVYLMAVISVVVLCNYVCVNLITWSHEVRLRFPQRELPEPEGEPADPNEEPMEHAGSEDQELHPELPDVHDHGHHEGEVGTQGESIPEVDDNLYVEVGVQAVSTEVDVYREVQHHLHRAEHFRQELLRETTRAQGLEIELRREITRCEAQAELIRRYTARIDELTNTINNDMDQRVQHLVEHMTTQNIYVTGMGDCWHADYLCARRRTQNVVYTRRPCRICVQRYGEPGNGPQDAGYEDDFRNIDGA